ncbi:MarR family transcriptional regulator [Streptomyces nitrosporeus]|uniref:MarR family transcriptional regulator n=1 Tax=Streptomyces nitrosporeus TaxID=28894 RepID=UPI00399F50F9
MAAQHLNAALPAAAAPPPPRRAHPGYGKQTVHGQHPSNSQDFAFLPVRERYVAGYVDRLPDGAAMDIKSLAKDLPLYGQMAIGSALRALAVAGHLRRVRCRVESGGQYRWVTRTHWSRTAHDNEWWTARLSGDGLAAGSAAEPVSAPETGPLPSPDASGPYAPEALPGPGPLAYADAGDAGSGERATTDPAPGTSAAYLALAGLGRHEPRLGLSAADCAALEPLAAAWFARGVDTDYLVHALSSGIPAVIDAPRGFVRRRLTDKIPPRLPRADTPPPPGAPAAARPLMVECAECGRPGPPGALPDGLCRSCRAADRKPQAPVSGAPVPNTTAPSAPDAQPVGERDVTALVGSLRNLMRAP